MSRRPLFLLVVISLTLAKLTFGQDPPVAESYFHKIPQQVDHAHLEFCTPGCFDSVTRNAGAGPQITIFSGVEGSKQPQDFGVNANLGGRIRINASRALIPDLGFGIQIGSAFTASGNAVQVFEALGESTGRTQSFTTAGIFQRLDNGISWGVVYDFLYQDSFDNFELGQWRIQASSQIGPNMETGVNLSLDSLSDEGLFNSTRVRLDPIPQFNIFLRRYWITGANTTVWIGQANGHGEDNAVLGAQRRKENTLLMGAEIFAPLNSWMAIFGQTNLISPADTGAVDAFLGVEISLHQLSRSVRDTRFRPLFPVASGATFTNDLTILP